jgi:FMN phosphatase YigB (HAD superfamily)
LRAALKSTPGLTCVRVADGWCYDVAHSRFSPQKGGLFVIGAVLFDLDGTLLDIDIDSFLEDYFGALGPVVADVMGVGGDTTAGLRAVLDATSAMMVPHAGITNRDVFNKHFKHATGVDLDLDEFAIAFEHFYKDVFPSLRKGLGPRDGAREVVQTALELGLRVAIATNPIFPADAIRARMRWADIEDLPVGYVTTYEVMHATKPLPAYFSETAEALGVEPARCLMVGDDRVLDMGAADVGMRTFYVGLKPIPAADYSGDLRDLAALLPRLVTESD